MKKTKVPFPENLKKREKLEGDDWKKISEIAGIKSPVYVSEIYRGLRKETKRIADAYDKLMEAKKAYKQSLKK